MPSVVLRSQPTNHEPFDLLGMYHNEPAKSDVVIHVGLAVGKGALQRLNPSECWHIEIGSKLRGTMNPTLLGCHPAKSASVIRRMEQWMARFESRFRGKTRLKHFQVLPAKFDVADNSIERVRTTCTGFVLVLYKYGFERDFLDLDSVPAINAHHIKSIYPIADSEFHDVGLNSENADPSGGWRVVLPGYLFHALNTDCVRPYKIHSFDLDHRF